MRFYIYCIGHARIMYSVIDVLIIIVLSIRIDMKCVYSNLSFFLEIFSCNGVEIFSRSGYDNIVCDRQPLKPPTVSFSRNFGVRQEICSYRLSAQCTRTCTKIFSTSVPLLLACQYCASFVYCYLSSTGSCLIRKKRYHLPVAGSLWGWF